MEAICSSETSVDFQRTTRRHIPEDNTRYIFRCSPFLVMNEKQKIGSIWRSLLIYWRTQIMKLSLTNLPPNTPLSALGFSLTAENQFSHAYKTTGKIMILCRAYMFLDSRWEDDGFWAEWKQTFSNLTSSWSIRECKFDFLESLPNIWTLPRFQRFHSTVWLSPEGGW
jgi:hypothetical protein